MVKNGSSANAASSGSTLSVKSKMGTQIFLSFFAKIILKAFSTFVLVAERKRVNSAVQNSVFDDDQDLDQLEIELP